MNKVVLITGASSGIGKATAQLLAQNGYTVYGAARRLDKMKDLENLGVKTFVLDITDDTSVTNVVNRIIDAENKIDILINNAGFGSYGAIEDVPIEDARYQLEVNVFGAMRITQQILPYMRKNGYGKIVNISSIGGKVAFPLGSWYHASKFALEALSDSLRNEVKQFGIDVIVIEPGGIKTEWGGIAAESAARVSGHTAYREMVSKFLNSFKKINESKVPEPVLIAKLIRQSIEATTPKTRYSAGYMARQVLWGRKFLSDKAMDKIIAKQFK
ncbi:MAG: oxidoreductase [Arachidicoccus sp.]|nr:oxidoreductase [Arachidicoccus sp.]